MPAGTETPSATTTTTTTTTTTAPAERGCHLSLVFSASSAPATGRATRSTRSTRSTRAPAASASRPRDLVSLSPSGRALRRSVQAHALARGTPVDADALSIVLAAKVANHVAPVALFTEEMVWQLLWIDVFTWCAHRRIDVPDEVAVTLWSLLSYLDETETFHPESEPLSDLHAPLMSSAGLGPNGTERHPTGRRKA